MLTQQPGEEASVRGDRRGQGRPVEGKEGQFGSCYGMSGCRVNFLRFSISSHAGAARAAVSSAHLIWIAGLLDAPSRNQTVPELSMPV
jgi:hypothetical protein